MLRQRLDGCYQVFGRIRFQQISLGSGLQHFLYDLLRVRDRQNQNAMAGFVSQNLPCGFQPIQVWHSDVQNDHIGLQLPGLLDCFTAISSLSANNPSRMSGQQRAHTPAYNLMVISNKNSKWVRNAPPVTRLTISGTVEQLL